MSILTVHRSESWIRSWENFPSVCCWLQASWHTCPRPPKMCATHASPTGVKPWGSAHLRCAGFCVRKVNSWSGNLRVFRQTTCPWKMPLSFCRWDRDVLNKYYTSKERDLSLKCQYLLSSWKLLAFESLLVCLDRHCKNLVYKCVLVQLMQKKLGCFYWQVLFAISSCTLDYQTMPPNPTFDVPEIYADWIS